jgi:hypothetical protein
MMFGAPQVDDDDIEEDLGGREELDDEEEDDICRYIQTGISPTSVSSPRGVRLSVTSH